ncbi:hypothetical protein MOX02_18220 [Methylobacterium oxalidis]|jgi:hypothetical protein|uniref:Uncharacterized protein n=2 Tax=Methylobacterium TaxID=407 RepID=A0A512J1F1_9HYPH|nr:hypothetical protein MOX02_18220 [Methylobacterium oxalidis]GJD98945.1 hypothetical protein GMJLKIPL_0858 [Methylobacterium isbiliense]GJE33162.1 hypothetical protein LDDCCGHA_3361 [Methylobacterium oxalidis]GLS62367.1 hypothetical protein GCM10007888_07480 [Methylobacterium oxalidis]
MIDKPRYGSTLARSLVIIPLMAFAGGLVPQPAAAQDGGPVDRARALTKDRTLPKAKPGAVGTPPIITRRGSSVRGTPAPSKARDARSR